MSFFAEIAGVLGLTGAAGGYQLINYNGEAVYIEGFNRILSISEAEIILLLKKGKIIIRGDGLNIHSLENNALIIKGEILDCIKEVV